MPDLSRRIVDIAYYTDEPGVGPPQKPQGETLAIRIGSVDDFEEEVETSEDALGRPIDVGRTLEVSYFIREDQADGDAPIIEGLKGVDRAWVQESYQEQGGQQPVRIFGAENQGARVYTAQATVDGLKGTMLTVVTSSVDSGANIQNGG